MKRYASLLPTILMTAGCALETGGSADSESIGSTSQALSSPSPAFTVVGQTDDGFLPPDTDGAVSSSFVVTTVNNFINVKDRSGNVLISQTLFSFWSAFNPSSLTDPRVKFDPFAQRFVISQSADFFTPNGRLLLAVSKTADPRAGFFFYQFPASSAGNHWLDFPQLAMNSKWVVISGTVVGTDADPTSFIGLWAFDKTSLYSGGAARFTFINLGDGAVPFPAETYDGTTGDMFICRPSATGSDSVDLYRLSGAIGSETLTQVSTIASPLPTRADSFFLPQAGGTPTNLFAATRESPDCVFRNGSIWATQNVIPTTGPTRLAVQWLQISSTGTLQSFGRLDDPTGVANYYFPAIAVNKNNEFLIGFSRFSADTFPSAAYAVHLSRDAAGTIEDPVVYHAGAGTYSFNRWGDYTHSQVDPVNDTDFWTIQEATQANDSWVTWWAQVSAAVSTPTCTEATAIDLGAPANAVTVSTNACLRVRDGFPFWWGTKRPMLLQNMSPGNYPVPFTWSNACSGGSGSGTYTADWQTNTLTPTSSSCAVLIQLKGSSTGHITLRYFGGN